jgi:hypothetical protein
MVTVKCSWKAWWKVLAVDLKLITGWLFVDWWWNRAVEGTGLGWLQDGPNGCKGQKQLIKKTKTKQNKNS